MTRIFIAALAFLGATAGSDPATAQRAPDPAPKLWLVPVGDTVFVHLLNPPAAYRGFTITRRDAAGTVTAVTRSPVRPIRDPAIAAATLSDERDRIALALQATDDAEIVRRLHSDPFAGTVLSLVSRKVGEVMGVVYADTTVVRGETYDYDVQLQGGPAGTPEALAGRITVTDVQPAMPSGVNATQDDDDVVVTWTYPRYTGEPHDYVVGFHVYRAAPGRQELQRITSTPVLRGNANTMRFTDADVFTPGAYRYAVRAVDVAGRVSAATLPADITVVRRVVLEPAQDVVATPGDNMVALAWRMATELDAAGYHVERSEGLDKPFTRLTSVPLDVRQPSYTDSTVQGGLQYFYRIVVTGPAGEESEPSNAMSAVPNDETPPAPPQDLVAAVKDRRFTLTWNPSDSRDIRGYYVYRGNATVETPVRITPSPVSETTFADSGYADRKALMPGASYTVRVTAVDLSYNESEPVEIMVVIPDDEAPMAPRALALQNVDGRHVLVTWTASEALDVGAYTVTRRQSGAPESSAVLLGRVQHQNALTDTSAQRNHVYVYSVVAVDTAGNESQSVSDSIHFRSLVPLSPPRHVDVRQRDDGKVEIRWERVVGDELAGYHVYRATSPTGVGTKLTATLVTETQFVDEARTGAVYYTVRAVDRSGNESKSSPAVRVGG